MALALAAEPHLEGRDQLSWLERLKADQYNLAAALQWAWDQERSELVAQMSGALGGFWSIHGFMSEGKQWLTAVLSQRHQLTAATLAQVLFASGWLAFERGDHAEARRFYEESLALWRDIGDKPKVARLLNRLGHAVQQQGEFAETKSLYEESLALYEALGDKRGVALALNRLGHLAQLQRDNVNAVQFLERSLAWRRELDDKRGMASSLNALAETIRYQGDFLRAAMLYEESLDLCRQLGDKRCVASVGHNLGYVALYQADYERAVAFFKDSLYLFQELENRGGVALCLAGLAAVLGAQARPVQAAQLFGASEALLTASSTSLSPTDRRAWDQNVTLVRSQLEEGAFIIAHASGRFMSVEQALKLVSICSPE